MGLPGPREIAPLLTFGTGRNNVSRITSAPEIASSLNTRFASGSATASRRLDRASSKRFALSVRSRQLLDESDITLGHPHAYDAQLHRACGAS